MWGARNMPAPPYDGFRRSKKHVFRRMRQGTFSLLGRGAILAQKKARILQFGHTRYVLKLFYKSKQSKMPPDSKSFKYSVPFSYKR